MGGKTNFQIPGNYSSCKLERAKCNHGRDCKKSAIELVKLNHSENLAFTTLFRVVGTFMWQLVGLRVIESQAAV